MQDRRSWGPVWLARVLHVIVAVAALTGVALELRTALNEGASTERLVRLFSFFTIDSNLLVAGGCALLAFRPAHDGRLFRPLRLAGVLCIVVTGLVYNTVLTGLRDLTASGAWANALLHQIAPVVALVGWVVVGPRPRITWVTVGWATVLPLAWIAYTFIRGAIVDWYPYPFLDVTAIGGGRAAVNTAFVAVVFIVLASGARWLDRRLPAAPHAG